MEKHVEQIVFFIQHSGLWGPIICCFLIIIESIFPILPLAVFIGLNAIYFGHIVGFIVSWVFTIIGCILSYTLFRDKLRGFYDKKLANQKNVKQFMKGFDKLTLPQLTVLAATPFAPAFLINIVAGLNKLDFKKFLSAIIIGKISIVIFWGYVGTSFVESFQDPLVFIKVMILLILVYILSKIISKKLNIE